MKPIRIAQIGTSRNSHGNNIWESLTKQKDLFEVVGYALPENEREKFPEQMPAFEGYKEYTVKDLLADPTIEAVTIETEEVYLTRYAQMAADAGKPIHMEKPGGCDIAAFDRMMDTIIAKAIPFHTGYMYRNNPMVKQLMTSIQQGELGDILYIDAQMNCLHPAQTRQWLSTFPGGMMFFLGCHLVDLVFRIQGMPCRVLPLNTSTGKDGTTGRDLGMAVLEYPTGMSTIKTSAVEYSGFSRRSLTVVGTKKSVEIRPLERYIDGSPLMYTDTTTCSVESWTDNGETTRSPLFDRYDAMMADFARMVRGEMKNPYTPEYERALYHLVMQCCGAE